MQRLDDVLRCFLYGGGGGKVYRSESSVPCNSVRGGGQQKTVAVNMAANLYCDKACSITSDVLASWKHRPDSLVVFTLLL
jgi:hypothetical protein